jgi:signal transduction histidine kinase/ActR/RegA family two-component response regulator
MRPFLARLPIRAKLVAMIMLTSGTVLVLAGAGYLAWDYYRLRADLAADLQAQAQLVLENSEAALNFQDPRTAAEILATLAGVPRLSEACLYDKNGAVFATWRRSGRLACAARPSDDRAIFKADTLELVTSGVRDGKKFGTISLQSDTGVLTSRLRAQAAVTAALLMVTMAVALVLSSQLQDLVSGPILQLAQTAADVSARGDYSVRARKVTDDELGALVDAFNRMLVQIQQRESELREANRLKDEFLATLSHELRTPLNAILGWTKLLRSRALPVGSFDRALEKIDRNAQAQARLVEDLLEVSRITTGKLRLDLRNVDLAAIVQAAVESMRPSAEAREVMLETAGLDQGFPFFGDPDRLQQVIWNLLSNAVKFTQGGGRASVSLARSGDTAVLVVRDTGVGIDPVFLPNVFDTFRQADASSTRQHGGLGLGLSIARRLVELHGGAIEAFSDGPGRGARFTVRLPARITEPLPAPARPAPAVHSATLAATTILVVDDEEDALELLVSVLESAGAIVFAARSADEALRLAIDRHPQVLVSDLGMPGTDGLTLMRQIRATLGAESPHVTIAVTAYASERDRERSAAAGFQRHLAKPLDPTTLVDIVAGMLTPSH